MQSIPRPNTQAPINSEDADFLRQRGISPVSVALKAADLIDVRGLAKYTRLDEDGRMCIHGAVAAALGVPQEENMQGGTYEQRVAERLILTGSGEKAGIADWNNAGERTAEEVIDWLRERADYLAAHF